MQPGACSLIICNHVPTACSPNGCPLLDAVVWLPDTGINVLHTCRYFAGEIEFGVVSQCSYVFSQVEAALSVIVDRLDQLSGLAAQTQRLDALVVALGGVVGGCADAVWMPAVMACMCADADAGAASCSGRGALRCLHSSGWF